MALVLKDRVKGWTDSYGEDNFVIFATTNGYQSFSVIGNGNQTYYTVFDPTNYDWEVGIGTYTAATTTLSRDTILSSSNNNLIVSFLPGTKELFVGYPAEKAVTLDTPQTITDKTLVNATVTSGTINNTTIGATTPASGAFTTLVASGASLTSVNAGVALLTSATVTTLNATGASIASANIGNLQFTAASIASINAGVAVITNLTATGASIASMNAGVALLTTATVTSLTATGASVASANVGTAVVTGLTVTNASIASLNAGTATVTTGNLTFSSTAQRITGDMSNATLASRLSFQSSTTNGVTSVQLIPNGTATTSNIRLFNGTDTANSANATLQVSSAETTLTSGITGTGTYLPMTFYTNGSERMRLDTSGNLGIGGTPGAALSINKQSTALSGTGNSYGVYVYPTSTGATYVDAVTSLSGTTSLNLRTYNNGTYNQFVMDSSGNVGIGTASPGCKLDVYNSAAAAANNEILRLRYTTSSTAGHSGDLNFTNASATNVGRISSVIESSQAVALSFWTFGPSAIAERMRIDGSGNVGIGTASPAQKLDVVGTSRYTFNVGNAYTLQTSINAAGSAFADDYKNALSHIWQTSGTERMRIDSSGNVGIGTASPFTTLDVNGYFTAGVRNTTNISLTAGTHYFGSSPSDLLRNNIVGNINTDSTTPVRLRFYKSRGTSASPTAVSSGDQTNDIQTYAYDGSSFIQATAIQAVVTATPSTNNVSSALSFSTNGGSSSPTERMRIDSSGNVGIGGTADAYAKTQIKGNLPASGGTSVSYDTQAVITSSATSSAIMYESFPSVQNASFTLPILYHFIAAQGTKGASATVTNQYGFFAGSSLTGATNNYGFYSDIASGSNRWNFYAAGTARNYFAGRVAVGTTQDDAALHVLNADDNVACRAASSKSTGLTSDIFQITALNHASGTGFYFERFYSSGPTVQFGVRGDGTVYAQNTTIQSLSDARVKENVRTATEGLAVIDALRPVRFDFKNGFGNNRKNQLGFVAQEVEAVFPDAVDVMGDKDENGDPYKSVGPAALIPVLVKAIQELSARLAALEAK